MFYSQHMKTAGAHKAVLIGTVEYSFFFAAVSEVLHILTLRPQTGGGRQEQNQSVG